METRRATKVPDMDKIESVCIFVLSELCIFQSHPKKAHFESCRQNTCYQSEQK